LVVGVCASSRELSLDPDDIGDLCASLVARAIFTALN